MLKRFEQPDEVRTFEKGKFEIVRIGGMTRPTNQAGDGRCMSARQPARRAARLSMVGIVVSGRAVAAMDNGALTEMTSSISHPDTTAGWSATSRISPYIFSVRTTTPTIPERRIQ
jgi:hypothetical protein